MSIGLYVHMLNAFLLCVLLILSTRQIAGEIHLVDTPDARKWHEGNVPLSGGFAIFTAFMVAGIGFQPGLQIPWNWEIGLGMLVLLGMADDRWRLPPLPRLVVQTVAALILLSAFPRPIDLGSFAGMELWQIAPLLGEVIAVLFVVGTVNAINMLDGVDGLAGASASAALFWLALIAFHEGAPLSALHALVLLAAVFGFLLFNLRHPWRAKAAVFLGDGGSLMLGAALAFFIINLSTGERSVAFPVLLWVVILPIADTLSLIVRRLASGRSPFSGDRSHLHHLLIDAGFSPAITTALISGASALCGAVAYCGVVFGLPDDLMLAGLVVPLCVHAALVHHLQTHRLEAPAEAYELRLRAAHAYQPATSGGGHEPPAAAANP
mgnify:CR=1 FL=1|jgi:UDP-N-acetylmuramyl pentapeptide phosphotransferase/UDP-N-acetylglucosamine-1-phosphate transferase